MNTSTQPLLDPIAIGDLELPNRIVMAPMTRARADNPDLAPTALHAAYYAQRASAGLIISEGSWPSREAIGAINVPGIFTEVQAEAWKRVTDAVHAAGGRIFVQLGHVGGASHPDHLGGSLPAAPSAINPKQKIFTPQGFKESVTPRAMTVGDIQRTIADYAMAAKLGRQAGFDGVELHGSNIYLIPQFLNDHFNTREDQYGGSAENRARFVLEALEAMISEWSPGRVGLRLSPGFSMGGFAPTAQTLPTYEYLIGRLSKLALAYLHLVHPSTDLTATPVEALKAGTAEYFRNIYRGRIVANGGFSWKSGNAIVASGDADLVSFAKPYIANPDLVERFANSVALTEGNPETYYRGGVSGYIDYPRAVSGPSLRPPAPRAADSRSRGRRY